MTRTEKSKIIDDIKNDLTNSSFLYIVDTFGLNAEQTAALRRSCFESNVKLKVVKNTLLKLAMSSFILIFSSLICGNITVGLCVFFIICFFMSFFLLSFFTLSGLI